MTDPLHKMLFQYESRPDKGPMLIDILEQVENEKKALLACLRLAIEQRDEYIGQSYPCTQWKEKFDKRNAEIVALLSPGGEG